MVEEGVRRINVADETKRLAWVVLQTANWTQAKGSSVRLVVPRAPEVTRELEPPLAEAELLTAEEYLLERGYVAPANIGLTWGTYTITPAGYYWLEGGLPEPTDRVRELAEKLGEGEALELAVRTELEEESNQMAEIEWELEEVRQEQPGAPETAAREPEKAQPGPGGFQTASEGAKRRWWRRVFGG
jgi:hypothetical protein